MTKALQCYECESTTKSGCGDPFDKNSMTDAEKRSDPEGKACMVCFII